MKKTKNAIRNEQGAIDLASVMAGIVVMSLLGGLIAATVFAVIPWAQDKAAKEQLKAISQAQNVHAGFAVEGADVNVSGSLTTVGRSAINIPTELPAGVSYGTLADLEAGGLFSPDTGITANGLFSTDLRMCASPAEDGRDFAAAVVSKSGKTFMTETASSPVMVAVEGDETCLGTVLADGIPEIRLEEGKEEEDSDDGEEATIPWNITDASLRGQVAEALGVEGDLMMSHADKLTNEQVRGMWFADVTTFDGLEKATNVNELGITFLYVLADTKGLGNIESIERLDFNGNSTITTLNNGFEKLETIGTLSFGANYSLTSVTAFAHVEHMGELNMRGLYSMTTVDFAGLETVGTGGLNYSENGPITIGDSFKKLTKVEGEFIFTDNYELTSAAFPELKEVGKNVNIYYNGFTTLDLGELTKVGTAGDGGVNVSDNSSLVTLSGLEELEETSYLRMNNNAKLTNLSVFSSLTDVETHEQISFVWQDGKMVPVMGVAGGDVSFSNNSALTSVSLPKLKALGGEFRVSSSPSMTNINISALTSTNNFEVTGVSSDVEIVGLSADNSYGTYFTIMLDGEWHYYTSVQDFLNR